MEVIFHLFLFFLPNLLHFYMNYCMINNAFGENETE